MGCCANKDKAVSIVSYTTVQSVQSEDQLPLTQTKNEKYFFLTLPCKICKEFLKIAQQQDKIVCLKDQDFKNYLKMLRTFKNIVQQLQSLQKSSIIGMDQDVLSGSGKQSQTQLRRRSSLNKNGLSNSQTSPKKQQAKQEEQQIVNMAIQMKSLYIDLKNPQLKLLLLHEKIQLVQDSQLYQIKLKISVYYNGESLEGFEHIYECPVNKKKIGIQKEKQVNLDQYVNFILKSNLSLSSNQEFCQHSYILFEIFTINTKNKESIQKEREQTISFNELKNQMLLEKNLKFFKETDQIYSQVTKFDLQLQTQLIYNQKKFLAETVQESQVLKDAVYDFNNNYKKILQKQKKQQNQQKQTNSSENSQVQESTKETFQTESEAQFNPTQIFYNLFKEDYNKRSTLKSQRFSYQPKSYQNFDSTFQSNNKISALDFQESYSFQNVYMVKEESDYEQDFEESNEKIKEEEEEDNNNEEYKSELFLNYNTFKPQQKINLNLDLKNDQDDLLNSDGIKQDNEDFSTPILLQYDYYSSDNNTSPIFIKKVNPSSDYIEK